MCQLKLEHKTTATVTGSLSSLAPFLILCKTSHASCDVTRVCADIIAGGFSHLGVVGELARMDLTRGAERVRHLNEVQLGLLTRRRSGRNRFYFLFF